MKIPRKIFLSVFASILAVNICGCDSIRNAVQNNKVEITLGEITDNTYTNEYFGITVELPPDCYVLAEDQRYEMLGAGTETLAGEDKTKKKKYDLALQKVLPLLVVYEKNPSLTTGANANIIISAEKISSAAADYVKSPKDYITASKQQLEQTDNYDGVEVEYMFGKIEDAQIGGKDGVKMSVRVNIGNGFASVYQDYYAYFYEDYAISISSTYADDTQKTLMMEIIDSIEISK